MHLVQPTAKRTAACVAAAEYLPADCGTAPVDVADALSGHCGGPDRGPSRTPPFPTSGVQGVLLSVDDAGRLVCADRHSRCPVAGCGCWILSVPLADDCHSYNCRLTLLAAGTVTLRTTAPVPPGQPLKMWFPPDLQLMLHVPFLTPVNIKDERKYVCHECGYACEKPNPLKIHLALDCGRSPRAKLWSRLLVAGDSDRDRAVGAASFRFSLRQTPPSVGPRTALSSAESAFRPYSPESSSASSGCLASPSTPPRPPPTTLPPPPPTPRPRSGRTPPPSPAELRLGHGGDGGRGGVVVVGDDVAFFDRRCAEMETIVSNLGHSEQGHLCIYCGKVYSRKYGLKIHIRTHTGFKPLKCKYCYRPFGDPSNLNKHVRLHAEGDTPYKCDCCGKILVRKRDLDRHMKSRHAQIMPKSVFKMHVPV